MSHSVPQSLRVRAAIGLWRLPRSAEPVRAAAQPVRRGAEGAEQRAGAVEQVPARSLHDQEPAGQRQRGHQVRARGLQARGGAPHSSRRDAQRTTREREEGEHHGLLFTCTFQTFSFQMLRPLRKPNCSETSWSSRVRSTAAPSIASSHLPISWARCRLPSPIASQPSRSSAWNWLLPARPLWSVRELHTKRVCAYNSLREIY